MSLIEHDLDKVLVLDVETGGLDPIENGLLSIGAVWLLDLNKTFYIECCVSDFRKVTDGALGVNGFTREQCFDKTKPSEHAAVASFLSWVATSSPYPIKNILIAGENPFFDRMFCQFRLYDDNSLSKSTSNWGEWPFKSRMVDLHSISFQRFHKCLSHSETCKALLIPEEDKPHHALKGALSEARCFRKFLGIDPMVSHEGSTLGEK